jgi:hypothetical protein
MALFSIEVNPHAFSIPCVYFGATRGRPAWNDDRMTTARSR